MRMGPRTSLTAAEIINDYSEDDLTRLFRELGEEPAARRIATMIVKMRRSEEHTSELHSHRDLPSFPTRRSSDLEIINDYSEDDLTRLFRELGEEPAARRIATMIVKMR